MSQSGIYYKCDYCNKIANPENATVLGWNWFTGYNKNTTHICAQCIKTKNAVYVADFHAAYKTKDIMPYGSKYAN
jgi:hypothetical protein